MGGFVGHEAGKIKKATRFFPLPVDAGAPPPTKSSMDMKKRKKQEKKAKQKLNKRRINIKIIEPDFS